VQVGVLLVPTPREVRKAEVGRGGSQAVIKPLGSSGIGKVLQSHQTQGDGPGFYTPVPASVLPFFSGTQTRQFSSPEAFPGQLS
jgi:hypothetical protein